MRTLIVIRGPLGIGKTTIAKKIAKTLKAKYFSVDNILAEKDLDKINKEQGCIPVANFLQVNQFLLPKIKSSLKRDIPVVMDGNFYHKKQLVDLIEKFPNEHLCFTLTAPLSVCIQRDAQRLKPYGKRATSEVYNLVSRFNYGQIIRTDDLSINHIVKSILEKIGNHTEASGKVEAGPWRSLAPLAEPRLAWLNPRSAREPVRA